MTERERDERDLNILREYEGGISFHAILHRYGVTTAYLKRLLREALDG